MGGGLKGVWNWIHSGHCISEDGIPCPTWIPTLPTHQGLAVGRHNHYAHIMVHILCSHLQTNMFGDEIVLRSLITLIIYHQSFSIISSRIFSRVSLTACPPPFPTINNYSSKYSSYYKIYVLSIYFHNFLDYHVILIILTKNSSPFQCALHDIVNTLLEVFGVSGTYRINSRNSKGPSTDTYRIPPPPPLKTGTLSE